MPVRSLFATPVYVEPIARRRDGSLNRRLLAECRQLRHDDAAGRRWSRDRYPGGYTSYGSASRMHRISPTFAELERLIDRHVRRFTRTLAFDLGGRHLTMTDCWVNLMPPGTGHGLHLHPLSALSGTYYVATPPGSPGLKLEDPRLDRLMASPPRRVDARPDRRTWVVMPVRAGTLLLFESWLRHEVPVSRARGERVSVSFNYGWN